MRIAQVAPLWESVPPRLMEERANRAPTSPKNWFGSVTT